MTNQPRPVPTPEEAVRMLRGLIEDCCSDSGICSCVFGQCLAIVQEQREALPVGHVCTTENWMKENFDD